MKAIRFLSVLLILGLGVTPLVAKTPPSREKKQKGDFPSFEDVQQVVEQQLASSRGYESGDLVTVGMVSPIFAKLEKMNWKVAERREIQKSMLPDSDWLVRQFATRNGKKFMRQIAELSDGYDRADRLRRMPYGERQLADMIRSPDGSKMIQYMTTTQGGKNLGRMLNRDVNGQDFNKPTGRIYNEAGLLKRLKKSYEAEAKHRSSERMEEVKSDDSPKDKTDDSAKTSDSAKTNPEQDKPAVQPERDPFEADRLKPHG